MQNGRRAGVRTVQTHNTHTHGHDRDKTRKQNTTRGGEGRGEGCGSTKVRPCHTMSFRVASRHITPYHVTHTYRMSYHARIMYSEFQLSCHNAGEILSRRGSHTASVRPCSTAAVRSRRCAIGSRRCAIDQRYTAVALIARRHDPSVHPHLPGSVSPSLRLSSPFRRGSIMNSCCRHELT